MGIRQQLLLNALLSLASSMRLRLIPPSFHSIAPASMQLLPRQLLLDHGQTGQQNYCVQNSFVHAQPICDHVVHSSNYPSLVSANCCEPNFYTTELRTPTPGSLGHRCAQPPLALDLDQYRWFGNGSGQTIHGTSRSHLQMSA